MSRRAKHRPAVEPGPAVMPGPGAAPRAGGAPALWFAAALLAPLFARPLAPCEGLAWQGDGLPFCLIWCALAVLAAWRRRNDPAVQPCAADACFAGLWAWQLTSLLANLPESAPRAALDVFWQQTASLLLYAAVRWGAPQGSAAALLVLGMLSAVVVEAGFGWAHYLVGHAMNLKVFAADPDAALRAAGLWLPPGSPERKLFEDRLRSPEPLGTFALTNSLAGLLAPWLGYALFNAAKQKDRTTPLRRLGVMAAGLLVLSCLCLTHSRSALAALVLTLAAAAAWRLRGVLAAQWQLAALAGAAALGVGALAWQVEAVRQATAGATLSLSYRMDYWNGAAELVAQRPLTGVGPGQFQDWYPAVMSATAGEEVADPHNWAFELAAVSGLPALVLFVAGLVLVVRRGRATPPQADGAAASPESSQSATTSAATASPAGASGWRALLAVAIVAPAAAMIVSAAAGLEFTLQNAVAAGAGFFLTAAILRGSSAALASADALRVLLSVELLNLCAAGGWSYPGVSDSLWLALALLANQQTTPPLDAQKTPSRAARGALIGTLFIGIVGAACCYATGYAPVFTAQTHMFRAEATDDPVEGIAALEAAAVADPLGYEAALRRGLTLREEFDLQRERRGAGDPALLASMEQWFAVADRRRPRGLSVARQRAECYEQAFAATGDPLWQQRALDARAKLVALCPTHPIFLGEQAQLLAAAGRQAEAAAAARRALQLSALTPHANRKLSRDAAAQLRRLVEGGRAGGPLR